MEVLEAMTAPTVDGQTSLPTLPKRGGPKGLLPSTWLERTLRVSYVDANSTGVETRGTLLDLYPFGPVLSLSGEKPVLAWDALRSQHCYQHFYKEGGPQPLHRAPGLLRGGGGYRWP